MAGHPVDAHVGLRVRQRRTLLGMSQEKLGESVGLTFQQIQKYERGANRIGSSRLFEFSKILDVPVSYFFEDMPVNVMVGGRRGRGQTDDRGEEKDPLAKRETLELVRGYYKIDDTKVRKRIFEMVKAVGTASRANKLAAAGKVKPSRGAGVVDSTVVRLPRRAAG